MASHSLAIAKASLAAGLMRPDPKPAAKTDIAHFHHLLDALIVQCTAAKIQLCKEWLLKNTAASAVKTAAVGKYLVALSANLLSSVDTDGMSQVNQTKRPCRRLQLHILYLLHDLLHHSRFHNPGSANDISPSQTLEPHIFQLVALATKHDASKHTHHFSKLKDLISIWREEDYFPSSVVAALQETIVDVSNGSIASTRVAVPRDRPFGTVTVGTGESQRDVPFIMPSSHGDASVPYYDLPAGNLMPFIVPNSSTPISPQMVKPLQVRPGPADDRLARAVKAFLRDADAIYESNLPEQGHDRFDIDELGQTVLPNDASEDIPTNEGGHARPQHLDGGRNSRSKPLARDALSRSRSRSYSPPDIAAPQRQDGHSENVFTSGPPQDRFSKADPPPPAFLRQGFLGAGQIPIPPPPPPNYSGPWPVPSMLTASLRLAPATAPAANAFIADGFLGVPTVTAAATTTDLCPVRLFSATASATSWPRSRYWGWTEIVWAGVQPVHRLRVPRWD
ncbi:MAG: hypothetical protein L6R40_003770 [Gallowayella cf. fulva]|nr:MAG: hypothetical protein L6R40_003770 [Xanthomendoza cf. fulva]